ncbi:hypothetical protein L917_11071 [Phytophthora nicotianae]|nr:hypothetical protein L917_11071 [Phytophthora nicotianae]
MNDDDGVVLIIMLALAHEGQEEKDGAPHPYQEMTSTLLVNPGRIVALFPLLQRSAWCSTLSVLLGFFTFSRPLNFFFRDVSSRSA